MIFRFEGVFRPRKWRNLPWVGQSEADFTTQFVARRFDSLSVEAGGSAAPDWLAQLPGLRRVLVFDRLTSDAWVWRVPALEAASLHDGARTEAQVDAVDLLQELTLDHRPGLASARRHPTLRELDVSLLPDQEDLSWLHAGPQLRRVHLDGKRRARLRFRDLDLTGVVALSLHRFTVAETLDLSSCSSLRGVAFTSMGVADDVARQLVQDLAALPDLEQVNVYRCAGLDVGTLERALPSCLITKSYG